MRVKSAWFKGLWWHYRKYASLREYLHHCHLAKRYGGLSRDRDRDIEAMGYLVRKYGTRNVQSV